MFGLAGAALCTLAVSCQSVIDTERFVFATDAGRAGSTGLERDVGSTAQGAPASGVPDASASGLAGTGMLEPQCLACRIDGSCVGPGEVDPNNGCRICDPSRASHDWSDRVGECDDGMYCTVGDACLAGECTGAARECDDGIACNGVSSCDEAGRSCTSGANQCSGAEVCDTQSGSCASTCDGCSIDGICVPPGAERAGNPCLVCQPLLSMNGYSGAPDKPCGNGPTECSAQDTCDVLGECRQNHALEGLGCGNTAASACDLPDSCDGNGSCLPRFVDNGVPCEDGFFCTAGDQCQGGSCVPTAESACPSPQLCNETANQCQCPNQGCLVGTTCVPPGANPENGCEICAPERSTTGFSANTGASCGAAATTCSGQDTCDAAGVCQPNHLPRTVNCRTAGECRSAATCDGNGVCPSSSFANGTRCDDGDECTAPDRCQSGECIGPFLRDEICLR